MHGETWFRIHDLQRRYDVSRQTIQNWRKMKLLPPPVKIGPNTVGWPPEVIEAFERKRADDAR